MKWKENGTGEGWDGDKIGPVDMLGLAFPHHIYTAIIQMQFKNRLRAQDGGIGRNAYLLAISL